MSKKFLFSSLLVLFVCVSSQVMAGQPRLLEAYDDWNAYVFTENGSKVCYMASKPKKSEGNYTKRGDDIFALITHRPGEGTRDVFSYIAGYSYKPGSDVSVSVNGDTFSLFTQDDTAWAPDGETDTNLAVSIQKGSQMVVKGTSSRGTLTTDTFGLKGSGNAYKRISKECGY